MRVDEEIAVLHDGYAKLLDMNVRDLMTWTREMHHLTGVRCDG